MRITRQQLRILLEQEVEKLSDEEKAAAEKKIEDEGGALGKDDFVKTVNDVNPDVNYSEEEALRRAQASIEDFKLHVNNDVYIDKPQEITETILRKLIKEELEKIGFYKKYSYGLDKIPNQTKAHDDIIGHTWLTHVKRKDSALNEIGKVLWHSLDESGHIAIYDVEWPSSGIETDIPAILLEKVKDSNESVHEEHGVKGHEEDLLHSKRKYKK